MTNQRYRSATVFIDHFSHIIYVYIQRKLTPEEKLKAKQDFEAYSLEQVVIIRHYHYDNGILSDNTFIKSVNTQGQKISYRGVNAHFQN